jgi:hypothetical protein
LLPALAVADDAKLLNPWSRIALVARQSGARDWLIGLGHSRMGICGLWQLESRDYEAISEWRRGRRAAGGTSELREVDES